MKSWAIPIVGLVFAASGLASDRVRANVPFSFELGGIVMPAGEYVLDRAISFSAAVVHSVESMESATVLVIPARLKDVQRNDQAMLTFTCYDKRCFLSQVWNPLADQAYELLKSKQERELVTSRMTAAVKPRIEVVLARAIR